MPIKHINPEYASAKPSKQGVCFYCGKIIHGSYDVKSGDAYAHGICYVQDVTRGGETPDGLTVWTNPDDRR